MQLDPDFAEFLGLLHDHDVRFLVVGGYAVAAHGRPRYTGDLDVWLLVEEENAARVTAALRDFGSGRSRSPRTTSCARTTSSSSGTRHCGSTS